MISTMGGTALLVFLLLNAVAVGIIGALAVVHWRAHKHKVVPQQKKVQPVITFDMRQRILREAEEEYEKIIKTSARELQRDLHSSTVDLHKQANELGRRIISNELRRYQAELEALRTENTETLQQATSDIATHRADLQKKLDQRQAEVEQKLTSEQAALEEKFVQHSAELDGMFQKRQDEYIKWQQNLEVALSAREKQYADRQSALETELEAHMAERREKVIAEFDTKMGDAVVAFLTESLGTNVDLGAQLPYLTATLAEHKEDLLKELS